MRRNIRGKQFSDSFSRAKNGVSDSSLMMEGGYSEAQTPELGTTTQVKV